MRRSLRSVYFTDRGIEELAGRRGQDVMGMERLADVLAIDLDQAMSDKFASSAARYTVEESKGNAEKR